MRFNSMLLAMGVWLTPIGAPAQDAIFWKTVGDWEISIDTTIGNGCYALASWKGGAVLRIGLNPAEDNFYMLLGNDNWASLEPEQSYDIEIKFGNKPAWEVAARGLQFNPGETVYLHAQSTKFDFIEEFMRQSKMVVTYNGNEIENLSLRGSSRAFKSVIACQEEVDAGALVDDPFAGSGSTSGRKSADPFSN